MIITLLISFIVAIIITISILYHKNHSITTVVKDVFCLRSVRAAISIALITFSLMLIATVIDCVTSSTQWDYPENAKYRIKGISGDDDRYLEYYVDDNKIENINLKDTADYTVIMIPDVLKNEQMVHAVSSTHMYAGHTGFATKRYNRSDTIFICEDGAKDIKERFGKQWLQP